MENTIFTNADAIETKPEYGMKWHKFLIWVGLFFLAAINIFDGIQCMQYTYLTGMAAVFGIAEILIGVFLIYVRFALARFKVNAVDCFTGVQVAALLLGVIADLYFGEGLDFASMIGTIGMIKITREYYSKRAELFVN